jgi:hypothetical protein
MRTFSSMRMSFCQDCYKLITWHGQDEDRVQRGVNFYISAKALKISLAIFIKFSAEKYGSIFFGKLANKVN